MTKGKKYSDWTAEEKAAYKAKREAYWKKRDEDLKSNFEKLTSELEALKVDAKVLALLEACKKGSGVIKGDRAASNGSYLNQMFGTEEPVEGQVATYLFIGVRGPNGERMNDGESMKDFVTRTGDANYRYDANTIASMVWYLKKRGHEVINNRQAATVTYVKYVKPADDAVLPTSPAEAPNNKKKVA